jgi:hypothetical protein
MDSVSAGVESRISRIESRVRLMVGINLLILAGIGAAVLSGFSVFRTPPMPLVADSISVQELRVVDASGVVRVRLSANMPDAVIRGRRVHRPQPAAGVMLYDDLGQERGGYVTFTPSRSIALTLDTRQSQVASLEADSSGGAALGLFQENDRLEVRADKAAGTGLFVWKNGGLTLQSPPISDSEEAKVCTDMKNELAAAQARSNRQLDRARILASCRLHMSDNGCRKCFGS